MAFKNKILLGLFFLANTCIGQTTKVLDLTTKKGFSESNLISIDTGYKLKQELCYEGGTDMSYCMLLTLIFSDIPKARELKKIDLGKDTSIVKCIFNWRSTRQWVDKKTIISGSITIKKWTKKAIVIDFDVNVYDENVKNTYIYFGERVFTR